jgi:hypothetical protein
LRIHGLHAGHIKRGPLDPPTEVRTRARKDITNIKSICNRQMKFLLASDAVAPLTTEDTALLRGLHYSPELRNLVTLGRLIFAWQTDPATRPLLEMLLSPSRAPTRCAVLPLAAGKPAAAAAPVVSPDTSGHNGATNSADAARSAEVAGAGAAATAATAETGSRPAAHDPRKLMLAQLIADQVKERRSAVASMRELSDSVEDILSDSERSVTLDGRVDVLGKQLQELQVCFSCDVEAYSACEHACLSPLCVGTMRARVRTVLLALVASKQVGRHV